MIQNVGLMAYAIIAFALLVVAPLAGAFAFAVAGDRKVN
jgi:hypothetical protein